ncbi:MAG: proline--tRNA ligase [Candidatus Omnitrophota bacterium]
MKWTETLIPTLREDPQDAEVISHKLLVRGGFIRKLTAGAYSYLPLGFKVLNKVENIIRQELNRAGALELLLPALQPLELWKTTGRDADLADVMIKFRDRHGRIVCLGPTHEEVVTSLMAQNISSYRDLPKTVYQIQTKFRDEIRPRFGVIRSCEFIMKDAYSFDADAEGLEKSYKKMYEAYCRIFERCGLPYVAVQADCGVMGGGESHEFMVPAEMGEDLVGICGACGYGASKDILIKDKEKELGDSAVCPKCKGTMAVKHTIEVGHTFKLGTKYSKPIGATYLSAAGETADVIMGCYGIGVNRIPAALVETSNDKDGIIWPVAISPYEVSVLPLNMSVAKLTNTADMLYSGLLEAGVDVILDDRAERAGVKFKDSDLIGFPISIILGEKNIGQDTVEIKIRKTGKSEKVKINEAVAKVKFLLTK